MVACEAAATAYPSECALDHPSPRLDGKAALAWQTPHHADRDGRGRGDPQLGVGAVSEAARDYGTIIGDFERRRVVDLLPDRTAGTLASWLNHHGDEVTLVSRDRSGAYADGIRPGMSAGVQVADRQKAHRQERRQDRYEAVAELHR